MIKSYLLTAWRTLKANKFMSAINILGLSIGIAAAILVYLWVYDELSFNKYHHQYDSITKVMRHFTVNGKSITNDMLPYDLALELKSKYQSNFKSIAAAWPETEYILADNDKALSRTGQFADPGLASMLSLKVIQGSNLDAHDLNAVLISHSVAASFFGQENAVGKQIRINNKMAVIVKGVYEDIPANSSFHAIQFFAPLDLFVSHNPWVKEQGYNNNLIYIYAAVSPVDNLNAISKNIRDVFLNNVIALPEQAARKPQLFLHPMRNWHFYSDFEDGAAQGERVNTVRLTGLVGLLVLLLACINFINLTTARSEKRSREVGIRKAIGSTRFQLIKQFMGESFLLVALAFLLALFIVLLSLPWFNELSGKQLSITWNYSNVWLACIAIILFTGFLSGCYPAIYLSSFKTIKVLKGVFRAGKNASFSRKALIVTQFSISLIFIICTMIIYRQIQTGKDRAPGYSQQGLIMIDKKSDAFKNKFDVLRNELLKTGVVAEVSESEGKVTQVWSLNDGFDWKGKDPNFHEQFGTLSVTPEYGRSIGWQVVAGRDFSRQYPGDSVGFVINEAAAKYIGLENPVGETIQWIRKKKSFTIVGVVKDMVMISPFEPVKPTIFFMGGYPNCINIRLVAGVRANNALSRIAEVYHKVLPSVPFDYSFADENYLLKFAEVDRVAQLSSVLAIIAILISCLGLFGMASFITERRIKEIGIRKVLGANMGGLLQLLSREFVFLVLISCCIAIPVAYYFMADWLQQYTYRTELSWWIFTVAGTGALLIALLTISFQTIKAALANPVKSLRSE